jgi:uncharacterized membrane protein YvlD (DUF360 family)
MDTNTLFTQLPALNLSYWALQILAMCLTSFFIPGLRITSILGPVLAVIAIAFVNATVWSAALFFQVPEHISVHVLVLLLSNGLIFWIIVKILPGIEVSGLLPALAAPLVYALLSLGIAQFHDKIPWPKIIEQGQAQLESLKNYATQDDDSGRHDGK